MRIRWLALLPTVALLAALQPGLAAELAAVVGQPRCSASSPWPAKLKMEYVATAKLGPLSLDGENEVGFTVEQGRYRMHSATRSSLYRAQQESRGAVEGRALRPQEYTEQRQRRAASTTTIDWAARTVSFSANAEQPGSTSPALQDRLTVLLQLGERLRAGGTGAIELPVAGARHVSAYRFERRGAESLTLPAGQFETYKLERQNEERDEAIELWLAPSLCWLPVKLRFTDERGLVVENALRRAVFD